MSDEDNIDIFEVDHFSLYDDDIEEGMICNDVFNTYIINEIVTIYEDDNCILLSLMLLEIIYDEEYVEISDEEFYVVAKYVFKRNKYRFDDFIIPNDSRISLINLTIGRKSIYSDIVNLQLMN